MRLTKIEETNETLRTLHFERKSRIKRGHRTTVQYAFGFAV